MINKLTKVQQARMAEFRDRWIGIGLCTEPADRPRAEAGVRLAYQIVGLAPPRRIVWCGSPLSQGLTRAIVSGLKEPGVEIGDSVWDSVRDSVRASVWDSVRDSVWDSVGDSIGDSVWNSVGDSVWDSVWDSVRDSIRDSVWDSIYGQHDANWLAYYDYFREVCGLSEETQRLTGLLEVARAAGWWLPHRHVCWVSERHHTVRKDDRGRLHCETGPAVGYPDGWGVWAWHGVRVAQWVIEEPASITIEEINKEQNAEVRRVLTERMGWERYLKAIRAKVLDRRRNDIEGTSEALMAYEGGRVLVCACPSTGRVFGLEVPADTETCMAAQRYLSSGLSDRIVSAS